MGIRAILIFSNLSCTIIGRTDQRLNGLRAHCDVTYGDIIRPTFKGVFDHMVGAHMRPRTTDTP